MCQQIAHFFRHYKDLERGKWVTIVKWLDVKGAEKLVLEGISRAQAAQRRGKIRRSGASTKRRPEGRRSQPRRKR
jgi:inorganic pyrophosphatase